MDVMVSALTAKQASKGTFILTQDWKDFLISQSRGHCEMSSL